MTLLGNADQVVRSTSAATAEVDGQLVALDVNRGVCYGLNRVATRIWALTETATTADAVSTALLQTYAVDPAECREQTLDLLRDLLDAGLIETVRTAD